MKTMKSTRSLRTRERILKAIKEYISSHGYAPSIREIAKIAGVKSTSTVHIHLKELMKSGEIESDAAPTSARAIRVINDTLIRGSGNDKCG